MIDFGWHTLRSNWFLRQLDVSYNRFHRHPLYRHWSLKAYEHPLAHHAETAPEKVLEVVVSLLFAFPAVILLGSIFLSGTVMHFVEVLFTLATLLTALVVSISGLMLGSLLAAMPIAQERNTGRWELLMLLPRERANILVMRISSMVYPYRPILVTLDILQSLTAFLSVVVVSAFTSVHDEWISLCFIYLVPCLLLISWERRQDHVLSLAVGAFTALHYDGRRAFSNALIGAGLIIALRLMFAMSALLGAGTFNSFAASTSVFIGGPSMLPIAGVPLLPALGIIGGYFLMRELLIAGLWHWITGIMNDNYGLDAG